MTAIDTNVLVRILTNDEPRQAEKAIALLEQGPVLIPVTVMLETEWVLRFCYRLSHARIAEVFRTLLSTPGVVVDDRDAVARATDKHGDGADFADALHVSLSEHRASRFCTFDRKFAQSFRQHAGMDVVLL